MNPPEGFDENDFLNLSEDYQTEKQLLETMELFTGFMKNEKTHE